jgi:outer membrane murein-binding lipoprotein Lpp
MNLMQKALIGAAIVGSVIVGGAFGAAITGGAFAQTDSPTDSPSSTATPEPGEEARDKQGGHGHGRSSGHGPGGGHVGENGTAETLLTGETAQRVTDAVMAEHPGATIERVETDAEGAAYEAHIVQADGTRATVKLDESFTVTETETGR